MGCEQDLFPDGAGLKALAAYQDATEHLRVLVFSLFLGFSTVHPWFSALFD